MVVKGIDITTTSLPQGTVNTPYSTQLTASGGASPYTWSATGLPSGLIINSSTGVISGTPSAAGSSSVTMTVTDSTGETANQTLTLTINNPADTTPPSAPSNLTATAIGSSRIDISWTASTDNVGVTGYRVERCQGINCNNFIQVAALTNSSISYSDTTVSAATSYSYRILAVDAASNQSAYSNTASATTPSAADTTPPTAPSILTATANSSSQINLTWNASTDNVGVANYLVERCQGTGCSNFNQINTATITNYSDPGLSASTTYRYQIRAVDAASNQSAYSNIASATTPNPPDTTPPTAPSGLTSTANGSSRIDLAWTASTDNIGVTGYQVERCQATG
ncbi:MAG: fibronectin type III domain-containing protein, partial [Nitrospiria bacterium]